ncbi:MAG: hypothetical protein JXB30_00380, partial [Anaerolineae bacterium]|nr:hypothetical protein [Anaerolineae bacterium]
ILVFMPDGGYGCYSRADGNPLAILMNSRFRGNDKRDEEMDVKWAFLPAPSPKRFAFQSSITQNYAMPATSNF